jgi:acetylcholinesterase
VLNILTKCPLVAGIASWPKYSTDTESEEDPQRPSNFVFRADESYIELDDYRVEGMAYINSIPR